MDVFTSILERENMEYYKIFNEKENHNGFQFKEGLNILEEEWNPSGNCTSGGFYIAKEDIFAFLNYGPWIRKITLPKDAMVYENPGSPKKYKADKIILGRKFKITLKMIEKLISKGADVHADDNAALKWASKNGHLKVVKFLISKGVDVHVDGNCALRWASLHGHLEIVKFLFSKGADVHAENSCSLQWASKNGHLEIVKLLIFKGADVHADDNAALKWASENGHLEVVKFLFSKGANIHAEDNDAVKRAAFNGHLKVVKFLVSKGADIHANGDRALLGAVEEEHLKIVEFLISKGAKILKDNPKNLKPPSEHEPEKSFGTNNACHLAFPFVLPEEDILEAFFLAVEKGNLEVVKYFASVGVDIFAENNRALKEASKKGYLEIIKFIVEGVWGLYL